MSMSGVSAGCWCSVNRDIVVAARRLGQVVRAERLLLARMAVVRREVVAICDYQAKLNGERKILRSTGKKAGIFLFTSPPCHYCFVEHM